MTSLSSTEWNQCNIHIHPYQLVLLTMINSCSEQEILFVPLAVESLGGLTVTLKKTLKRIALLADSRNYQSQGHAIAFDRLDQSVSVVIVRGSATMFLARVP